MAAKKKEIRKVAPPAGTASRQRIVNLYAPQKAKQTQMIAGAPAEAARELLRRLRDEARVIE
jgi:electron transfer flavoprotein beta subunit